MVRRLAFIWLIWVACTIFTVQAKPISFASEYIETLYHELPKTAEGGVVDSIGLFQIRVTKIDDKVKDLGVRIENLEFDNPHLKGFLERKVLELLLAKDIDEVNRVLSHSKCQLFYNGIDYGVGLQWDLKKGVEVFRNCTGFSYQNNASYYTIKVKKGKNQLEIIFPVNIQIVTDKNKMELEFEFEDLLRSDHQVDIYARTPTKDRFYQIGDIYVNSTSFLYLEAINDGTYYRFDGFNFEPIFAVEHAVESFTNLFHFANENSSKINLNVVQWLYGNHKKEFTVSLDKLLEYCKANGINVYVGIEGREKNVLESSILLENKKMKFLHILHVKGDVSGLFEKGEKQYEDIMVSLYAYVPTDNIGNLFDDDSYKQRPNNFEILNE